MSTLHVFVYVCAAQEDVFAGVRQSLEKTNPQQHCITNLYLEDKEYDYITHVEFSIRKYARFLFYGSIFKKIESSIFEKENLLFLNNIVLCFRKREVYIFEACLSLR